jgi:Spy/CpxP family protein refolding chaperone
MQVGLTEEAQMKAGRMTFVALVLALVLAIGTGLAIARPSHHGYGGFENHMLSMMTDYLGLTDAQQAQVKQIFANEKPNMQPLMQQLHQNEQQLRQLETSNNFDEAKVRDLASQRAQVMTELTVEKAKVHNQIFNLLTPDQKTKAIDFLNRREQRFQQHMQHMQQNQAPAQQQ